MEVPKIKKRYGLKPIAIERNPKFMKKCYIWFMSSTLNIHDILSRVKELDKDEQLTLLERLVALIRKNESIKSPSKLSRISGIGSKIWKKTNIDEYIDRERQW